MDFPTQGSFSQTSEAQHPGSSSSPDRSAESKHDTQATFEANSVEDSQQPPPSPRLQPTYRSALSLNNSLANSPSKIRVRDLNHIQSFASEEILARSRQSSRHALSAISDGQQYEISSMPVTDIIEMVAGLLTKISTTNDKLHEKTPRRQSSEAGPSAHQQNSSVLAFHGRNVPNITIATYLMRIYKYCPATYEVFLSLIVYFDRMSSHINQVDFNSSRMARHDGSDMPMSNDTVVPDPEGPSAPPANFVVDSYNIHRLVMAGVTCASKFFSDVFYTNLRYARVGGLPLTELNHLELQFLLLNDFRLAITLEDLEAYGTMLVEFYANEIVTQQQQAAAEAQSRDQPVHSPIRHQHRPSEGLYMQTAP